MSEPQGEGTGPVISADGRQSPAAAAIARGASRLLSTLGYVVVPELVLASGRRADLLCISIKGEIWIVEIKSSVMDFRADTKWPEYREFCDRLMFAVDRMFPADMLPEDTGLIIADRYGGEMVREAPLHALNAARRKALTLRSARVVATRLQAIADPDYALELYRQE